MHTLYLIALVLLVGSFIPILYGLEDILAVAFRRQRRFIVKPKTRPNLKRGICLCVIGTIICLGSFISTSTILMPGPSTSTTYAQTRALLIKKYGGSEDDYLLSISFAHVDDQEEPFYWVRYRSQDHKGFVRAYFDPTDKDEFLRIVDEGEIPDFSVK